MYKPSTALYPARAFRCNYVDSGARQLTQQISKIGTGLHGGVYCQSPLMTGVGVAPVAGPGTIGGKLPHNFRRDPGIQR